MTKKTLKKFAELSYNKDLLDEKIVTKIAEKLSRKDLKKYIQSLRQEETKREVYVTSAEALTTKDKEMIKNLYLEKKVLFAVNPSMITGVKIVENDEEFEFNLDKTFDNLIRFLSTK